MTAANCRWCGMLHGERCPTVKAMEFHQDGTLKRVEFLTAVDYHPLSHVPPVYPLPAIANWPAQTLAPVATWRTNYIGAAPVASGYDGC